MYLLVYAGGHAAAQVFAEEADTAQTETVQDTVPKDTVYPSSADDLIQLAKNCRLDSWSKNRTVYLDADLELTGSGFAGIPSFSGVFEGQGHTISGLSLVDDGSVIGFFRYVQQGANIRDIVIRGRSLPTGSRSTVGGIAGSNAGSCTTAALRACPPVRPLSAASRAQICRRRHRKLHDHGQCLRCTLHRRHRR